MENSASKSIAKYHHVYSAWDLRGVHFSVSVPWFECHLSFCILLLYQNCLSLSSETWPCSVPKYFWHQIEHSSPFSSKTSRSSGPPSTAPRCCNQKMHKPHNTLILSRHVAGFPHTLTPPSDFVRAWCPAGLRAAGSRGEWISTAAQAQIVTLCHDSRAAGLAGGSRRRRWERKKGKKKPVSPHHTPSPFLSCLLPPVSVTDPRRVKALSAFCAVMSTTSANDLLTISQATPVHFASKCRRDPGSGPAILRHCSLTKILMLFRGF